MSRRDDDFDIIGDRPRRDETAGLGLFAVPSPVVMPGAGQLARMEARERTDASGDRKRVLDCLQRHPDGLTRRELADTLSMSVNTVNARVAELCNAPRYAPLPAPCYTEGHRERIIEENGKPRPVKESVVYARSVRTPLVQEGAA